MTSDFEFISIWRDQINRVVLNSKVQQFRERQACDETISQKETRDFRSIFPF